MTLLEAHLTPSDDKLNENKKDNGKGDSALPIPNLIAEADRAAQRIESANKIKAELLKQEEELLARKILSGRSEAGISPAVETDTQRIDREIKQRFGKLIKIQE